MSRDPSCPKCNSTNVESVSTIYHHHKNKEAVRLFFGYDPEEVASKNLLSEVGVMVADYALEDKKNIEEAATYKRFDPPKEPDTNMSPRMAMAVTIAGTMAAASLVFMLVSYFAGNRILAICFFAYGFGILAYCGCAYVLHAISCAEKEGKYLQEMELWQKKLFCEECGAFFS